MPRRPNRCAHQKQLAFPPPLTLPLKRDAPNNPKRMAMPRRPNRCTHQKQLTINPPYRSACRRRPATRRV
jgi:hypothetical protein